MYISLTLPLPLSPSRHKVGVTEPCCTDMPSSWNTLTPAWWAHLPSNMQLLLLYAVLSSKQQFSPQTIIFSQLFWRTCHLRSLTCYPSFHAAVPELSDYFALTDRQVGFWCGLARRLHRWLCTLLHIISRISQFRFLNSKSICPSQERPAGGPSIQPPSKGLKARRSGWGMTSFLSVFLQNDTW